MCDGLTLRCFFPFFFFFQSPSAQMVVFCPHCGNVLFVEHAATMRYYCPTCPYGLSLTSKIWLFSLCFVSFLVYLFPVRALTKKISHQLPLKKKVVDDILGGAAAWETAERTSSLFFFFFPPLKTHPSCPFSHPFFLLQPSCAKSVVATRRSSCRSRFAVRMSQ